MKLNKPFLTLTTLASMTIAGVAGNLHKHNKTSSEAWTADRIEKSGIFKEIPASQPTTETRPATATHPVKVGDTLTYEGCQYTITGYRALRSYGSLHATPDDGATFIWITFAVKNVSNETKHLDFHGFRLSDADLNNYELSAKGPFQWQTIQPTLTKKAELLFEVPSNAVARSIDLLVGVFGEEPPMDLSLPALNEIAEN